MIEGIHLAHKPVGATSFSVVQALREGRTPVCHGGALDPFAHGLLPLLAGPATRLFELLHAVPKRYEAVVRWGVETDNGDLLGAPVAQGDASALTPAALGAALQRFVGFQEQVPPAYSNKRVDGERAHVRARRGEDVQLAAQRVYLHAARFLSHDLPRESRLELVCRGGYYVRSLARDVGRAVGVPAHLGALWRSHIGPWSDPGTQAPVPVVRGPAVLPWAPSRVLNDQEVGALRKGERIARGTLLRAEWSVPSGFPDPQPPVRGLHLGKLALLLLPDGDGLRAGVDLRGL